MTLSRRKPPVIKGRVRRIETEIPVQSKEIDEGEDEYVWRATRIDLETASIVMVEYIHPDVGFYEEMCLFVSTMHSPGWECVPLSTFWQEWRDVRNFVKSFPAFKDLFRKGTTPGGLEASAVNP